MPTRSNRNVQAQEPDIEIAIDRIQKVATVSIRRPRRGYAGLRSFMKDGNFVGGFDAATPGFFRAAARGGYGIQTSPARLRWLGKASQRRARQKR